MTPGFLSILLVSFSTVAAAKSFRARDFLVEGLGDIEPAYASFQGTMYAGLLPSHPIDQDVKGELAFWLFIDDNVKYPDTLTIWLNGGPGCSSFGGAMFENSPVTMGSYPAGFYGIDIDVDLRFNPYSWSNQTAIMYVEQPHGTGYTTGPLPENETDVSRYFYEFLVNFYDTFDFLRDHKLNFFGESYAGMYVPSIAHYIHQQNKNNPKHHMNLAGIGIGNGWVDAKVQGPTVIDYAWWHGMIDMHTRDALHNEFENCLDGSPQPEPFHAFTIPDECNVMGAVMAAAGVGAVDWGGPNAYDISTWDSYYFLDAPTGTMATFYNNPKVREALHFYTKDTPEHWLECVEGAGRRRRKRRFLKGNHSDEPLGKIMLAHDQPGSVLPYIADLVDDAKIRVLIYSGDRDLTTNSQGSEMLLDQMKWSGAKGWHDTKEFDRGLWLAGDKLLGGYIKQYKNLEFLIVANSGHLVPMNVPEIAFDLLDRFLGGESYLDKSLPKFDIQLKRLPAREANVTDSFPVSIIRAVLLVLVGFLLGFAASSVNNNKKRHSYDSLPDTPRGNGAEMMQH